MSAVVLLFIESGRTPDFVFRRNCGDAYHLGWRKNLQQVFGTSLFTAFLPLASRFVPSPQIVLYNYYCTCCNNSLGDGCKFPMGYKARGQEGPTQSGRLSESDEELYDRESTPLTVP